jgi:hypothetical protein
VLSVLAGLASVLGAIAAYVALLPDVSVLPPLLPSSGARPSEELFLLVNNGGLPVYNIETTCGSLTNSFIPFISYRLATLHAHERKSFPCGTWQFFGINHQPLVATSATMTVRITYRAISILPWSSVTLTSFVGSRHDDGNFYWTEEPLTSGPLPTKSKALEVERMSRRVESHIGGDYVKCPTAAL